MHNKGCFSSDDSDVERKKAALFTCDEEGCGTKFTTKQAKVAHTKRKHSGTRYRCSFCKKQFAAYSDAHEHQLVCKKNQDRLERVECHWKGCKKTFNAPKYIRRHMKKEHRWGIPKEHRLEITSAEMGSGASDSESDASSDNRDKE